MSSPAGLERRKSRRRPVLETFSLFIVIPKKGPHRLAVRDVSDLGMRFDLDLDLEAAAPDDFRVAVGDTLEVDFYINQSLALPLKLQVARFAEATPGSPRQIGGALVDLYAPSYRAFAAFIQLLDAITEMRQESKKL
jgi:hypothetical protein